MTVRPWFTGTEALVEALFGGRWLMMANLTLNMRKPGWEDYLNRLASRLETWMSSA